MTAMEEEIYMLRRQVKILRKELGNTVFQQEALSSGGIISSIWKIKKATSQAQLAAFLNLGRESGI